MTEKELNEEKKEYLRGYRDVCNRITVLEHRIEELRQAQEQAKIQQISDMPKGCKQSDLSDYIVRLENLQEQEQKKCLEKNMKKLEIEDKIMNLSDETESNILYKRYIMLQSWDEIEHDIGYSKRHIYRVHGKALHDFNIPEQ